MNQIPPETPRPADAESAARFYQRIADMITHGELVFMSHADLGLRIKRALDDPDTSVDQATQLIQAEPLLAARVVAVANSVSYNRSGREIASVRQAVSRLGFRTLSSLAMTMLVKQFSGAPDNPGLREKARRLWEHTVHVAALAHVIAARVTHQDPETALFAGILHEIAGFYLLAAARDMPELVAGLPPCWTGEGEVVIGDALLQALEAPAEVRSAIDALWQGYLAVPPSSLGDTLLLAEALAPVASPLYWAPDQATAETAGCPRIEIALDEETLSGILAASASEVQSLINALQ